MGDGKVGTSFEDNAQWLIDFSRAPLEQLSRQEIEDVLRGFVEFVRLALQDANDRLPTWNILSPDQPFPGNRPGRIHIYESTLLRRLLYWQKFTRGVLNDLVSDGRFVFRNMTVSGVVEHSVRRGKRQAPAFLGKVFFIQRPWTDQSDAIDDQAAGFELRLFIVLEACAGRLGRCRRPECAQLFIQRRSTKQFCSDNCRAIEGKPEGKKRRKPTAPKRPKGQKGR